MTSIPKVSASRARRMALAAQGFADPSPRGPRDVRHLRRLMSRVGLLQVDSVNVLERSHYLPGFSRLGAYPHDVLDDMAYRRRELFEYWAHAACLIPIADLPLMRWRMDGARAGRQSQELISATPGYIERILAEVTDRGSLAVGNLDDPGERTGPWWGYGPGKVALEWLFHSGQLAIAERRNFTRYYDLPERVHGEAWSVPGVEREEAHRQLLVRSGERLGIGTAEDLIDYYRLPIIEARRRLVEVVEAGHLVEVQVEGWNKPAFLDPQARAPRSITGSALLSPFDSLVWNRDRAERIFEFLYRIEIYVPSPKRVYGYYVLPFLLDGALVGRVDLKADRQAGRLLVQASHVESGASPVRVTEAMAGDLKEMSTWLGLNGVDVLPKGDLAPMLALSLSR